MRSSEIVLVLKATSDVGEANIVGVVTTVELESPCSVLVLSDVVNKLESSGNKASLGSDPDPAKILVDFSPSLYIFDKPLSMHRHTAMYLLIGYYYS